MNLPKSVTDRIEKEARKLFPVDLGDSPQTINRTAYSWAVYEQGATSEALRSAKLVEALEAIVWLSGRSIEIKRIAKEALKEYHEAK